MEFGQSNNIQIHHFAL